MQAEAPEKPDVDVRDLLNAQTGRLAWPELQRHFARGVVLVASADLDLVETAAALVVDDMVRVQAWLASGRLVRADLEHARHWEATQPIFWAVVAAPWVLVQACGPVSEPTRPTRSES